MEDEGFSSINYTKASDGSINFDGMTTSFPYTRLNGEVPIEAFYVIRSAHNGKIKDLCQFF